MASIFVIDSEPTVRAVVTTILQRAGHLVRNTGDFQEALKLLRDSPCDLVLTNVFLKNIPGHEAMFRLREEFPTLRILMISGLPDENVIRTWSSRPNFDIFPKPFTGDALVDKVNQVLAVPGNQSN